MACAAPAQSGLKGDQPYYLLDVGIAMEHLVLAAARELGLGTCWIGWFDEQQARLALGVPEDVRVRGPPPPPWDTPPESRASRGEEPLGVERGQIGGDSGYRPPAPRAGYSDGTCGWGKFDTPGQIV